jgi:hypothetical protein
LPATHLTLPCCLSLTAGILCFQDFATFKEVVPSFLFLIGTAGSLVGVVVLSKKEAATEGKDGDKDEQSKAGDEFRIGDGKTASGVDANGANDANGADDADDANDAHDDTAGHFLPSDAKKRWNLLKNVRSAVKMVTVHEGYLLKRSSGKIKRWQRR